MITGSTLVRSLAAKRSVLEASASDVGSRISRLERDLNAILTDEGQLLRQMASIHIGMLDGLPTNVESILQKRALRIESEEQAIKKATEKLKELHKQREGLEEKREAAYLAFSKADNAAHEVYNANNEASSLRVEIAHFDALIEDLDMKYDRAVKEMDDKILTYRGDKLFMYLHDREFGTVDYTSSGVVKRIDGWLANLISYRSVAAHYQRLMEIPAWIGDRRQKVATDRDGKKAVVNEIADRIKTEYKVDVLGQDLKKAEDAIAEVDAVVRDYNTQISRSSSFISSAALANDEEMAKATKAYTDFLSRLGISKLMEKAKTTASTDDDKIVNALIELERRKVTVEREIASLKPGLLEFDRRVKALNEVERNIRSRGWSGSSDRFSGRVSDSQINDLASGMLTASAMWSLIESAYKRPAPSTSSSDWGSTGSYGGSSSSSSSSSSSGSWSSGGGFGGDSGSSWSTGGGFGGGDSSSGGF